MAAAAARDATERRWEERSEERRTGMESGIAVGEGWGGERGGERGGACGGVRAWRGFGASSQKSSGCVGILRWEWNPSKVEDKFMRMLAPEVCTKIRRMDDFQKTKLSSLNFH